MKRVIDVPQDLFEMIEEFVEEEMANYAEKIIANSTPLYQQYKDCKEGKNEEITRIMSVNNNRM